MAGSRGNPVRWWPEHSGGDLVPSEPHSPASQALVRSAPSPQRPRPRFAAWALPCPCSANTRLLFRCPLPAFSENKRDVQLPMSPCRVINLTAWGPVLLRAGLPGRVGVHNGSARRDLPVLTSFHSLMEVVLAHVAAQVVTLEDTGAWGCVLGRAGTVHKAVTSWPHWSLGRCRPPPAPPTWQWGCFRKSFVPSEPMNQLMKEKAKVMCGGGGGRGTGHSLGSGQGPNVLFPLQRMTETEIKRN